MSLGDAIVIVETPSVSEQGELASYAYSYPHKSSYRPLSPPVPIGEAWRDEDVRRLSLYVHIPFCEMRCGFCNLFTEAQPADGIVDAYLSTLFRQMQVVRAQVPAAEFAQFAVGGGTPTFLSAKQLISLFARTVAFVGHSLHQVPTSVETSPDTATEDRLQVLSEHGVRRISLGVQSFLTAETGHFGRPQDVGRVLAALERIRKRAFPVLNIDLMYGGSQQTLDSWRHSLRAALEFRPEELYLYPLYVRPKTGLAGIGKRQEAHRTDLYAAALDLLGEVGYEQASLRCFRRADDADPATREAGSDYACQRDGMIGLGCGARSYTQQLHYGNRFAVTQAGVRAIVRSWVAQSDDDLGMATHGIWLNEEERQRRFIILSLLQVSGLALGDFHERFPEADLNVFDGLAELAERGWLIRRHDRLMLTPIGVEHSDIVGPLLYSDAVRRRLDEFIALQPIGGASELA